MQSTQLIVPFVKNKGNVHCRVYFDAGFLKAKTNIMLQINKLEDALFSFAGGESEHRHEKLKEVYKK